MLTNPVWLDGEVVPGERATVHIMTPSLHYGWGAYEGIRFHRGHHGGKSIFRAADHLARFRRSNQVLGIESPFSGEELHDAIRELVAQAEFESGYIRPISYLRPGVMSIFAQLGQVSVAIGCWAWPNYLADAEQGIKVRTSSWVRNNPAQIPTSAKTTGGYLNPALARAAAVHSGDHETIMLNDRGRVAEAAAANVFVVRDGRIATPSADEGILPGITRDTIITLAELEGYEVERRPVLPAELSTADELFLTGTAMGVNGVLTLDGRPIGTGATGPITAALARAYQAAASGEKYHQFDWTDAV